MGGILSDVTTDTQRLLLLSSSLLFGLAAMTCAWIFLSLQNRKLDQTSVSLAAERSRVLHARSWVFRWLEPLVEEVKNCRWLHSAGYATRLKRVLARGVLDDCWRVEDYLGDTLLRSIVWGLGTAVLLLLVESPAASVFAGLVVTVGSFYGRLYWLWRQANRRVERFKRRLPFAIDLIALMMEAGAGFRQSLVTVVQESRDHPLGEELGRLLNSLAGGRTLHDAFSELRDRLDDDDIDEFVFAVQKAEELGTPLSQIFLNMADQMRRKRFQWLEKVAAQAKAKITFPGMIVMLACVVLIIAPFVLKAWVESNTVG